MGMALYCSNMATSQSRNASVDTELQDALPVGVEAREGPVDGEYIVDSQDSFTLHRVAEAGFTVIQIPNNSEKVVVTRHGEE